MTDRRKATLWRQLQAKKSHMPHFLTAIEVDGLRGLRNLRVVFDYPVSVIAGGNATGKTTVLFAAACAYDVPSAASRDFVPSTLFPSYSPSAGRRADDLGNISLAYSYATPGGDYRMQWRKQKSWNRSYFGRKAASQPERDVYLRALSNLTNPSEVRGVLSMSRASVAPTEAVLTAAEVSFAQRVLPFAYDEVVDLQSGKKQLLLAARHNGPSYSELHMASGERAVMRLARQITNLSDALVLVDEVEAGLHPWVQQLLMQEMQQLALRNNLQVIVTTHSPVVLDAVPENGRIFLQRDDALNVSVVPAYRDLIQNALYGRSHDALNILCEDDVAEGLLRGILDHLLPTLHLPPEAIRIGRDTGMAQFPEHARALQKFGQADNMIYVLDGDARDTEHERKLREAAVDAAGTFLLPGTGSPEEWIWDQLQADNAIAAELGLSPPLLSERMSHLDALYDGASDTPSNIAKSKLTDLADDANRTVADIGRVMARLQAADSASALRPLADDITDAVTRWREPT